jgi:hypothetical protein
MLDSMAISLKVKADVNVSKVFSFVTDAVAK